MATAYFGVTFPDWGKIDGQIFYCAEDKIKKNDSLVLKDVATSKLDWPIRSRSRRKNSFKFYVVFGDRHHSSHIFRLMDIVYF